MVLFVGELLEPGDDLARLVVAALQRERLDQVGGDREGPGLQHACRDDVVEDTAQEGLGRLGLARLEGGYREDVVRLEPVPHVAEPLRVLTPGGRPLASRRDVAVPHRDHGPHDLQRRGLVRAEVDVQQRVEELSCLPDAAAPLQDVEEPLPVRTRTPGTGPPPRLRRCDSRTALLRRGELTAPDEPLPQGLPLGGSGGRPPRTRHQLRARPSIRHSASSCAPSSIASSAQARHWAAFDTETPPAMKDLASSARPRITGVPTALGECAVHQALGVGDGRPTCR